MTPTTRDDLERLRRPDGDDDADRDDEQLDPGDELPLPPPLPGWAIFWNRVRLPLACLALAVLLAILTPSMFAFSQDAALVTLILACMAALLMFVLLLFSGFSWRDFEFGEDDYYEDELDESDADADDEPDDDHPDADDAPPRRKGR